MEDLSILWDKNRIEAEFVDLVGLGLSKATFEMSAKNSLGDDWYKVGKRILLKSAPELVKNFKSNYGSN